MWSLYCTFRTSSVGLLIRLALFLELLVKPLDKNPAPIMSQRINNPSHHSYKSILQRLPHPNPSIPRRPLDSFLARAATPLSLVHPILVSPLTTVNVRGTNIMHVDKQPQDGGGLRGWWRRVLPRSGIVPISSRPGEAVVEGKRLVLSSSI